MPINNITEHQRNIARLAELDAQHVITGDEWTEQRFLRLLILCHDRTHRRLGDKPAAEPE